ncbi:MAG: hypothetical protein ACK56I_25630, partial [bacterium]
LMRRGIKRHWNTIHSAFHYGIFYSLLWLGLGVCMIQSTDRTTDAWHVLRFKGERNVFAIRLADEPIASGNHWKAQGEVVTVFRDDEPQSCRGKISLTLAND